MRNKRYIMDKTSSRIIGYDVARALAILGMVIVNFKTVMYDKISGADWLGGFVNLFEGRAASTFVILAGVGMTLMSKRAIAENDIPKIKQIQNTLFKRSLFLFIVGLMYTPIWPADILHFLRTLHNHWNFSINSLRQKTLVLLCSYFNSFLFFPNYF